ncbi:MAG: 3-hydroxyacyl-CoA dehydrogenase [Hyphococcus sp.]|nr:MAG: 3-hydroxyacyl-CoA dehydrogenase [Marinicaulis sp.]
MFGNDTKVAVCGAGAMGAGIAQVAAQAGHTVIVLDQNDKALARGKATVAKGAAALLKRNKITEDEAAALEARVEWVLDVDALKDADLVIEAIVENADIKQSLFEKIEAINPNAVIATNTSSLSVTSLGARLMRPSRFLGLHFFNPAPIMKLVEVVSGADTDKELASSALSLMESWGKVAVNARDVPGFIVNRVARPYYSEGWRAYEEGAADAATIDFLFRDLAGFRMGPLELGDFIGHDINFEAARSIYEAYHGRTRFIPSLAQRQLVEAGRLGRKSGRGVYDYSEGAEKPEPNFLESAFKEAGQITLSTFAPALKQLLDHNNVDYTIDDEVQPDCLMIDGVQISFTDGFSAGEESDVSDCPVALLDWMRDPNAATSIAFSASCEGAREAVLKLAALCKKQAVQLTDRPGLVVFRTVCQLANCAADAVRDQVADADAIDKAMINGVNYPFGPFNCAREIGFSRVVHGLGSIASETGEDMYRPNEIMLRFARSDD